ncbi:MAG: M61 family peptidase [Flavobacteriaceae bacterium]|nr:M61 family peptidase [Flavobacteriaceae bacterium]
MISYTLKVPHPHSHVVEISLQIDGLIELETEICLPLWRPGRYQLQDYPKNILAFEVFDSIGNQIAFAKKSKGSWVVQTPKDGILNVKYSYYANQLDAGASYVDSNQIYINPCNCFLYVQGQLDKPLCLDIIIPENYAVATNLPKNGDQKYFANDYHEIVDSPFLASPEMQHGQFELGKSLIHIWIQGVFECDMDELLAKTKKYCSYQLEFFGDLPSKDYHFIYQMLPLTFHHGVEHCDSTVIALGPDKDFDRKAFYNEWMGVSCHEFFHLWNVKRIRPADMSPYDYSCENYSTLGWVYEGVTTYYGDLICLRTGVVDFEGWATVFNKHLNKHFENAGRYNLSVAASSFDTWLDGYLVGVPNRKVNIYTEGMLAALVLDSHIRQKTNHAMSLDDLMRSLYDDFYKKGKGYTEKDYQSIAENLCGESLQWYFDEVINGCGHIERYLPDALEFLGLELEIFPSEDAVARRFGLKEKLNAVTIWPGSPADIAGIDHNHQLESFNENTGKAVLSYFGKMETRMLKHDSHDYFNLYAVKKSERNQESFEKWLK